MYLWQLFCATLTIAAAAKTVFPLQTPCTYRVNVRLCAVCATGFIINDGQPGRDCYTFTATARELSNLLKGQANTDDTLSTALASQGMPDTWAVNLVRGSDQGVRQLSDWVAAAGVEPKQATCLLLGAHASKLGQQLEKSETSQEAVVGPGLSLHLREALLEVLRGAVRAVTDAMMQQGC